MTANQRRPGFRLPWSSEMDEAGAESESGAPASEGTPITPAEPATGSDASPEKPAAPSSAAAPEKAATMPPAAAGEATPAAQAESPATPSKSAEKPATESEPAPAEQAAAEKLDAEAAPAPVPSDADGGADFMRDLVSAMRRVAEEARDAGLAELRARADEQVGLLDTDADKRREDLRARAEADVDAVGEWAKAEAERITQEAEQRVVARRAQLEQQLAGDAHRTEAETKALRDRVTEYERELDAYHGQLAGIKDPAAFAAAAKRMPKAPELVATATPTTTPTPTPSAPAEAAEPAAEAVPAPADDAPVEPSTSSTNGVPDAPAPVNPAEEEVLAARLAQLDATLPDRGAEGAAAVATEAVTTEVVVKGLGSFGAITGFRQALSGVDGIDGVALSLGQTGEFVFRATHAAGFDVRAAIATLEGDAAMVEDRPEGGLRVTLDRAR